MFWQHPKKATMNVVWITLTKLGSYKQNFKLMHHIRLKLISDLKNTFNYSKIQLIISIIYFSGNWSK